MGGWGGGVIWDQAKGATVPGGMTGREVAASRERGAMAAGWSCPRSRRQKGQGCGSDWRGALLLDWATPGTVRSECRRWEEKVIRRE